MKAALSLMTVFVLSGCVATPTTQTKTAKPTTNISERKKQDIAPEIGYGLTDQKLTHAKHFMVATANPIATQAGYDILLKGGTAIDAMIAVQSTLGLVEPQSSGLGGGAFVVYWDNKTKQLTTFDGRETAPQAVDGELFMKDGKPMGFMDAVVGGRSVGVPAIPMLMETLHKKYGKLAWQSLFDTPIGLSKNGFYVSKRMADSIKSNQKTLANYKSTADYFLPNGKPLQEGDLLKNNEYANTLKMLAAEGSRPFYQGRYAQNIVGVVQNNNGALSMADFHDYKVIQKEPVCANYRSYQVCGMDAPSSGGIAVGQIVGVLNQFSKEQLPKDDPNTLRILGDASRLAFADREKYVADPEFVNVPSQFLMSDHYLKNRAKLIKNSNTALDMVQAGNVPNLQSKYAAAPSLELPSTSHISIVDKYGNVLSMTTSIENAFGSGLMANGYLLNNELTDFSFEPTKSGKYVANRVEGGKRPRSSMAPTIVMLDGKPYMAVGSPGGSRIIGYVAKTLVAHIDWGMDIQQAINYPNVLNRFGNYELEQNSDAIDFNDKLIEFGFKTDIRDLNSGVQGIVITNAGLSGGADPRREGKVMGR